MGNTATKNKNYDKSKSLISHKTNNLTDEDQITTTTTTAGVAAAKTTTLSAAIRTTEYNEQNQQQQQRSQELLNNLSEQQHHLQQPEEIIVTTKTTTADWAAAPKRSNSAKATEHQRQQQFKQISTWSLGSLRSGNFNWSFSFSQNAAQRNSFRQRNKSTRKSLTNLQQLRRSKTTWHKPITNAIFSSHFKESSSAAAHANNLRNFQIERLVAKGAFGIVFKVSKLNGDKQRSKKQQQDNNNSSAAAETTDETHFYALKVLKKSKILAENSVKQIKDEAEIQKLCGHHPFIVQQIDLWQNRHNLHILSEYVPNGELFSKIANFSLDLVRLYLAEIAVAIDFLHNAGIIYRDAKPENILLTQNFHLKLTDFGLSKWLKLGLTTRTMCGTFQYMAPELLRGEAYGHAVDWWSLGIIACQMLTQKSPDFRQFLQLTFLPATPKSSFQTLPERSIDSVDNARPAVLNETSSISEEKRTNHSIDTENFLPPEVEALPHEAKDVLKRLLVIDAKQRLRSVMALQKISLYKNLKIDAKTLLKISAIEIIVGDQIKLYEAPTDEQADRLLAAKAFHDF